MLPIPILSCVFRDGVIDLVLAELQLIANIVVKRRGERPGDRSVLRIVFRKFAEQIVTPTRKTGVEASGRQAAAALQLLHKLRQVHTEIGFNEVVFPETRKAGKLSCDSGLFRSTQLRTFDQSI